MRNVRRNINQSRLIILILICLFFIGITSKAWSYFEEQKQIKLEQQRIEEERRKEEEEKKKYMVGCSNDAKKYSYDARKVAEKLNSYDYSNNGEKIVFLTFDDGTSTTVTPQVLKILKENDVHATFFVTGENIERGGEKAKELLKQELNEGHAIANHSYTHDYRILYPNRVLDLEAFKADFEKTDKLLKDVLGKYFSTRVIRCPGGHMSWKGMDSLDAYLDENNMASIDWNALSKDAEGAKKDADQLANIAIQTSKDKEMVVLLMHDTYGKEETAKSLPQIIKYFKENGYEFKTLS
ncbi:MULTISPECIES: polysaccharide deacetylase family protein [unclassified Romboutsia]|uniref:polysaccharide deacetylase family protein n=1 Tax=unclassified Romboutsia TaxID=2626894 RepID=UPI000822B526|nr:MULTISPECIES: polysaccharide deacetylase family protein [unclassified Romboutsia]SCH88026.1 Bifunctional xylanase/deacetylase precursor [uncultured Clostridium sp.]